MLISTGFRMGPAGIDLKLSVLLSPMMIVLSIHLLSACRYHVLSKLLLLLGICWVVVGGSPEAKKLSRYQLGQLPQEWYALPTSFFILSEKAG